jgi:hypothetical protein
VPRMLAEVLRNRGWSWAFSIVRPAQCATKWMLNRGQVRHANPSHQVRDIGQGNRRHAFWSSMITQT